MIRTAYRQAVKYVIVSVLPLPGVFIESNFTALLVESNVSNDSI